MEKQSSDHDVVTLEWLQRHSIRIPRAAGVFQSSTAWIKIDAKGIIIAAGENDQTILAWLVEQKTLSSADVDYAIDFVTCRSAERAYRRQMGYKSSLDLSTLSGAASLSCDQAAKVFCIVRKHLGRNDMQTIEYACDTQHSPANPPNHQPNYRRAFTRLGKIMDQAVKDVKEGRISDDPQAGLKKMLARRIEVT